MNETVAKIKKPIEINFNPKKKHIVKRIFEKLECSELPVIIRGGYTGEYTPDWWYDFLKNHVKLQPDNRQYDSVTHDLQSFIWWEVSYQPGVSESYAHSNTAMYLHTDNAWFSDSFPMLFIIMQKQIKCGGLSLYYPISTLLDDLKLEDPDLFDDLTTTKVTITKGSEKKYSNQTEIIANINSSPTLHWNYYRTIKDDNKIRLLCERFFAFLQKKTRTDSVIKVHLNTGDCVILNDLKALHGRTSFEATEFRERILLQSMWKIK